MRYIIPARVRHPASVLCHMYLTTSALRTSWTTMTGLRTCCVSMLNYSVPIKVSLLVEFPTMSSMKQTPFNFDKGFKRTIKSRKQANSTAISFSHDLPAPSSVNNHQSICNAYSSMTRYFETAPPPKLDKSNGFPFVLGASTTFLQRLQ